MFLIRLALILFYLSFSTNHDSVVVSQRKAYWDPGTKSVLFVYFYIDMKKCLSCFLTMNKMPVPFEQSARTEGGSRK